MAAEGALVEAPPPLGQRALLAVEDGPAGPVVRPQARAVRVPGRAGVAGRVASARTRACKSFGALFKPRMPRLPPWWSLLIFGFYLSGESGVVAGGAKIIAAIGGITEGAARATDAAFDASINISPSAAMFTKATAVGMLSMTQ